ncbi:hypothetical protein MIH18_23235 (plasmid) [Marinobacter sp. M3C]|uniref:hypothetical protein n=1 Tax=Marinobacter sp. M3C TaxID=2917715 RepID=UPI00200EC279|nr:hypothetical protein [Marinobacter sp. M3C]UQG62632.1 hypothetical protein MIH18_23200 [Marinobacter sp. M3C]UQG62638.1 hypothetical protein MIH18_23235 [Marinobacter sp. M3C]
MLRKIIMYLGVALSLPTSLAYAESMTLKLAHQWPHPIIEQPPRFYDYLKPVLETLRQ